MTCGALRRLLASFAAAVTLSVGGLEVRAGDCGCDAPPCQTVYHVRAKHHCNRPPVGMVVPSMPVMPMMAMPMMMAPAMPVAAAPYAPVAAAPAPAATYQLTIAAPPAAAAGPTCMTQDQLVRALSAALANESGVGAVRSPSLSAEERLADLERRVAKLEGQTKALEGNTKDIVEILKALKEKADK